ncbi:UDP-glucose 4-epimerase [Neoconidiobolus thromboides FSU 785]|nr:UDP-glucose 4-epimerase [Neoconidiobolus thromboides FSU 785]
MQIQNGFELNNQSVILVTGGAGFIGSHTVLELLKLNCNVVVVDNLCNSSEESLKRVEQLGGKKLKFYKYDLRDENKIESLFQTYKFDAVIHFAGLKAVGESSTIPLEYYSVNIGTTVILLKLMEKYLVNRIVFSSSATVYGIPEKLPLDENSKTGCTNPYGRTKLFNEEIIKDACNGNKNLSAVLLRYFNPVGADISGHIGEVPNGIPNNLMPYVSQVAIGKLQQVDVFGNDYPTRDGTGVRDYIHVTDLALGHVHALSRFPKNGASLSNNGCWIYNLGTGRGYSVLEMIQAMEKASQRKIAYKIAARRPGDVAEVVADPSLAQKELGWKAKRGLQDMCDDLWRWQKKNPNGFKSVSSKL